MQIKFLSLLSILLIAANAHAVVVDFESDVSITQITAEPGWTVQGTYTIQLHAQGFSFGVNEALWGGQIPWVGQVFGIATSPITGNNYMAGNSDLGWAQSNAIWREDGQLFSVASLDLGGLLPAGTWVGGTSNGAPIVGGCPGCYWTGGPAYINGYDASGVLSNSLAVYAGSTDWQTVSFDSSWTNLSYIKIIGQETSDYYGFNTDFTTPSLDNFNATVVPLPAAAWLFASALGLIGWRSRTY